MVLGCIAPYHLAQGGWVGGQLAANFLLLLAVPSCSCSDQINESRWDSNLELAGS